MALSRRVSSYHYSRLPNPASMRICIARSRIQSWAVSREIRCTRSYGTDPTSRPAPSNGADLEKSLQYAVAGSGATKMKAVDWEDYKYSDVRKFDDLPARGFGWNQHMIINAELREALTMMLRQFKAPIMYCFAYGSGVFAQSSSVSNISEDEFRAVHPKAPEALKQTQKSNPKMIDFIFGVTHPQHWHSLNMKQHPEHYSGLAKFGSGLVTSVQENLGAGVYFNPYVVVNGMLIKYGVTSISNLCKDLSTWENMYLAGRLHKPVKILRDNASVRIANQQNLMAAVRASLLLLPENFTEQELFNTIAGLSYLGDPRMALPTENKGKVKNIVSNNLVNFRRLYLPLINNLPNIDYKAGSSSTSGLEVSDWAWLESTENRSLSQDMDPVRRANMVRRLPSSFRGRLYFQYQKQFCMTRAEFNQLMEDSSDNTPAGIKRPQGSDFDMRIAQDNPANLNRTVRDTIVQTIKWPSTTQSAKGLLTAGFARTIRYMSEKMARYREGKAQKNGATTTVATDSRSLGERSSSNEKN
ncbi:Phosphatidate cytidylyltransferase, mitochondrial [Ceratocystis fimbriata CBS 114723]|uniref:Phosphatidate cytidylyltransferase, mitochondrial n=1 Tax=Ceratocystis fimbriata CBS 114723 TaxID=1035309 RepID=A0A2C5XDS2_9PEZI|nr:Phosphatidate cytidylyltransferase, mitochondrial [Ceratocystis fimbriata CBS 114723]